MLYAQPIPVGIFAKEITITYNYISPVVLNGILYELQIKAVVQNCETWSFLTTASSNQLNGNDELASLFNVIWNGIKSKA